MHVPHFLGIYNLGYDVIIVFQMCFVFFQQQKIDDKSKFGLLWVAHIQNCHQTQGLLEMDIVVEPQRTETHTQSISQAEIVFFQEDNVSGRTPCKTSHPRRK